MQYAVFSQKIPEFFLSWPRENGVERKKKGDGREEWEEKNEISIFSKGVFL
jgi:hypothetical protein